MITFVLVFWLSWAAEFEVIEFTDKHTCEYALTRITALNEDVEGICLPNGVSNGQD